MVANLSLFRVTRSLMDTKDRMLQKITGAVGEHGPGGRFYKHASLPALTTESVTPSTRYRDQIAAMQDAKHENRIFGVRVTWGGSNRLDRGPAPHRLRSDALYQLGFTSARRSKNIMKNLAEIDVADRHGNVRFNLPDVHTIVSSFRAPWLLYRPKLTANERMGLRVYLSGVQEHMRDLSQDLSAMPAPLRPYWAAYVGAEQSLSSSKTTMNFFRERGILDANFVPIASTKAWSALKQTMLNNGQRAASSPKQIETYELLRNAFFPRDPL